MSKISKARDAITNLFGIALTPDTFPEDASCFTCKHGKSSINSAPCNVCRWGAGSDDGEIKWKPSVNN
jgi:hypothetical protein